LYSTIKTNDSLENECEQEDPIVWNSLCGRNVTISDTDPDVEPDSEDSECETLLENKLSGLKYATCLEPNVPQYGDGNEIFSVAPAE